MWVTRISDSQGYPIEEYHFESGWRGDDFIGKNTTDPTVLKPAKWLRETNGNTCIAQADGDSDHSNLQGTE